MTTLQWLAVSILILLLLVRLQRLILDCLPITADTVSKFGRFLIEDNEYELPCGGGVVHGHYQALFACRLLYGSRHTARLCARYLMWQGFVDTSDPETHHLVADTSEAYADIIFAATAGRSTRRELVRLRRRWAKGETDTNPPPTDLAKEVCDELIDRLS